MMFIIGILIWLHNNTTPPDPPDIVFERFVDREAYLQYLEVY